MTDIRPALTVRQMPRFGEFVAMMAMLMALTALSIDVMLPALPQIRDDFGLADPNRQQLVITAYVAGFAIGQLFHGPLSDGFGRKSVLLLGLAAYAAASFLCLAAGSFEVLLAARMVQGVANAAPRVVAVAVVRDVYGGRRMAEVMSFVMMVFIVVPILAPALGSAFLAFGSWHLIFAFLGVVTSATFVWMALRLPETRPAAAREPMSVAWVAKAFLQAIGNRQTLGYTIAIGVVFGSLMSYINSAQQVFVDSYRLGPWFPLVFACVAATIALASFTNTRLVGGLGMRRVSHGALAGFVVSSGLHLALVLWLGQPPVLVFVGLLGTTMFCFGLVMPNFNALAMEPMGRVAGTASSFIGALTTAVAAAIGLWVGQAYDGTVLPLIAGYFGCGVAAFAVVALTERGRLFRVGGG